MGVDVREPHWKPNPILAPQSPLAQRTGYLAQSPSTSTPTHSTLLDTPHAPVIRQISYKGAAKDQDNREAKEKDDPHVPEVHNRVLVITVGVWVLWQEKEEVNEGFLWLHKSLMLALHKLVSNFTSDQSPLSPLIPLSSLRHCQTPSYHRAFALTLPSAQKGFPPDLVMARSVFSLKVLAS